MKSENQIVRNDGKDPIRSRIFIATPTLGVVRVEWAIARYGATTPCNWAAGGSAYGLTHSFPMGFLVAEAQNLAVHDCLANGAEWLLLLEDDVLIPADTFLILNEYMKKKDVPVVSGLYYLKSNYTEPIVYRGRGNSAFEDFKLGDKVWVDGVPTGCLLIHSSVLRLMYDESEEYLTAVGRNVRRVFETPAKVWMDPESGTYRTASGTSDLYWCDRVMKDKVLERSGWKKFAKKHPKYPFLVDTRLACMHIDLNSGQQYPIGGFKKK